MSRWHLNRAGLFNFWYYDDAVFNFSDGRLILRGSNGSGKSVTMQSLIPLVLDGDKRPWRLDPFGSRDRRIEYYLLGDGEHQDRTAYLWLEFRQDHPERYVTVGIGLRARQTAQSTSFWGFALEDDRRIGDSFLLYRLDYSGGEEVKVPLSRPQLEQAIGDGGKVVTGTGEYKRLVNQVLFGFEDDEAYQELLDLLIQLRSPKLSKDFKPTTIYDILTASLPALEENELRPLSEVLEDMDEIGDRLDELRIHRQEAAKLANVYRQYNAFQLFTAALAVDKAWRTWREQEKTSLAQEQAVEKIRRTKQEEEAAEQTVQLRLEQLAGEREVLGNHEAIGQEAELKRLKEDWQQKEMQLVKVEKRQRDYRERLEVAETRQAEAARHMDTQTAEQEALLEELTALGAEVHFPYSSSYHYLWERDIPPRQNINWRAWRRDIEAHDALVKEVLQRAREVTRWERTARERERHLGELSRTRDAHEQIAQDKKREFADSVDAQQQKLFAWREKVHEMALTDHVFRDMLHLLSQYPDVAYERVRAPMLEAYEQALGRLSKRRAELEAAMVQRRAQYEALQAEWSEWRDKKDPEPEATEARKQSRLRRCQEGAGGAPLYAACAFREHVTSEQQARLESVLDRAGLLDAWLAPSGSVQVLAGEEEVWLEPEPQLLAHTLADWLQPTPSDVSNLTAAQIDAVLRTVVIGAEAAGGTSIGIDPRGLFHLGPLHGQAAGKTQAEYIGAEAREQTRQRELKRLEAAMEEEQTALEAYSEQLAQCTAARQLLTAERESFPSDAALEKKAKAWEDATRDLKFSLEQVKIADESYQEAVKKLRNLRAQLLARVRENGLPTVERVLEQLSDDVRAYERSVGDLKSAWEQYWNEAEKQQRAVEEIARLEDQLAEDETEWLETKRKQNVLQHEIETVERLLADLGLSEIHKRLTDIRREQMQLTEETKQRNQRRLKLAQQLGEAENRWAQQQELTHAAAEQAARDSRQYVAEWQRGLVAEFREVTVRADDVEGVAAHCHHVLRTYREAYAEKTREQYSNRVWNAFHETRQLLHSFVPEADEEGERMIIQFRRDRQHPQSPEALLAELEEEEEAQKELLKQKDRELYEQVLIRSVGRAIRDKIYRAEAWVKEMNALMQRRRTSSGLRLHLKWHPLPAMNEQEMDTAELVKLLRTKADLLRPEKIEQMVTHFQSRVNWARREAEERDTLRQRIYEVLDYRKWFRFTLYFEKGQQQRRELTDARFNVLSGGEKAMAMYIPLFAATYSRYMSSRDEAPHLICLDEAFAGVDEANLRDMFELLTDMDFDYVMTSQVLWGCYDTVPNLSIYELVRPQDADFVTLIRFQWNGERKTLLDDLAATDEGVEVEEGLKGEEK